MDLLLLLIIIGAAAFSVRVHWKRQRERINALQLVLAILLDEDAYQTNREGMLQTLKSLPAMDEPQLLLRALRETDYAAQTSAQHSADVVRRRLPGIVR